MYLRHIFFSLALVFAFPSLTHAAERVPEGQFGALAAGTHSCGEYVAADEQTDSVYVSWATGFISGANWKAIGNYRKVGVDWNYDAIRLWLRNYCTAHPLDLFVKAVMGLRQDLANHEGIDR